MEMNFLDEIFERINILESENKTLKEELKNLNTESEISIDNYVSIDKNAKINQLNELKKQIKLDDLTANNNREKDNSQFTVITINFKPYEDFHSVEIAGDFNNWKKEKMDKVEDCFIFKTRVLRGYSYKYSFYYLDNKVLNYEAEIVDDNHTSEPLNIIRVPDDKLPNKFNDHHMTPMQLFNLINVENSKMTLSFEQEQQLFDKIFEFSKFFSSTKSEIYNTKKQSEEKARNHYDSLFKICENYEKEKFDIYNSMFVNKIIGHNDQNYLILSINFSESYFKCIKLYDKNGIKIDINENFNLNVGNRFPFEKLYDNCLIHTKEESDKILEDYKKDDKNVLRIFYELLSLPNNNNNANYNDSNNLNNSNHNYNIFQQNSEEGLDLFPGSNLASGNFNDLNKAKSPGEDVNMDFIDEEINSEMSESSVAIENTNYHKIDNNYISINNPRINYLNNRNNTRVGAIFNRLQQNIREAKEIIPYKIQPDNIDLNNYNIIIENNLIKTIQSKTDENFTVVFEAKMIKEEISNKLKGLVSNSILKVYTSMYNKDIVNIIHIHLNDTSEEISVDSLFLEKSEMAIDHKNFKLDVTGKKLNYKFIFRDFKLIKILYNLSKDFIDEPHFEEIRIQEDIIVKINYNKTIYNGFYGKVKSIPIGMLARKDKKNSLDSHLLDRKKSQEPSIHGDCEERHLEDLIGFVDVSVTFGPDMSIMEHPIFIKIPVCKLVPLTAREQIPFEALIAKQVNLSKRSAYDKIDNFLREIKMLKDKVNDEMKMNDVNVDETRAYLNRFDEMNMQEELELNKLKEHEDLDYFDKVNEIYKEIPEIVKRLQIHLRNYVFFQKKK